MASIKRPPTPTAAPPSVALGVPSAQIISTEDFKAQAKASADANALKRAAQVQATQTTKASSKFASEAVSVASAKAEQEKQRAFRTWNELNEPKSKDLLVSFSRLVKGQPVQFDTPALLRVGEFLLKHKLVCETDDGPLPLLTAFGKAVAQFATNPAPANNAAPKSKQTANSTPTAPGTAVAPQKPAKNSAKTQPKSAERREAAPRPSPKPTALQWAAARLTLAAAKHNLQQLDSAEHYLSEVAVEKLRRTQAALDEAQNVYDALITPPSPNKK